MTFKYSHGVCRGLISFVAADDFDIMNKCKKQKQKNYRPFYDSPHLNVKKIKIKKIINIFVCVELHHMTFYDEQINFGMSLKRSNSDQTVKRVFRGL